MGCERKGMFVNELRKSGVLSLSIQLFILIHGENIHIYPIRKLSIMHDDTISSKSPINYSEL